MPLYVQQEKMGHAGSCHQLPAASLLCAQLLVRVVLDVLLCFTDNLRCLHTAFIVLSAWTAGRTHSISHPFNAVSLKTAPTPGSTDVMTTCFQDLWWIESSWLARLKNEMALRKSAFCPPSRCSLLLCGVELNLLPVSPKALSLSRGFHHNVN